MYELFQRILEWINSFVCQWGWSVVLFTLMIRILIIPFDYKSRVSMRKTQKLQPQLNKLQTKYANDKEKLNLKMSELYKKEKINPLSSCLPMLLTLPILWWMFGAMRLVANEQILRQVLEMLQNPTGTSIDFEGWLWVKNIMMPDSPFSSMMPSLQMLQQVTDVNTWTKIFTPDVLAQLQTTVPDLALTTESFTANLSTTVSSIYTFLTNNTQYYANSGALEGWTINLLVTSVSVMKDWNGLFLLPIFSALSQFLMTKMNPSAPKQTDKLGNEIKNNQNNPMGSGAFMTWFFPLFSLWICSSYNGMFALYWVASNLIAMAETFIINKVLDAKDAKAAAMETAGNVK